MPTIRDPLTDRFGGLLNPTTMVGRLFGGNPPLQPGIFSGAPRPAAPVIPQSAAAPGSAATAPGQAARNPAPKRALAQQRTMR